MSRVWMCHVTHMNESCLTLTNDLSWWQIFGGRVGHVTHMEMNHITYHVTHMNESCDTQEWDMSMWHTKIRHVKHMNGSCHTYCVTRTHTNNWADNGFSVETRIMSPIWKWIMLQVMSHIWMRRVTHARTTWAADGLSVEVLELRSLHMGQISPFYMCVAWHNSIHVMWRIFICVTWRIFTCVARLNFCAEKHSHLFFLKKITHFVWCDWLLYVWHNMWHDSFSFVLHDSLFYFSALCVFMYVTMMYSHVWHDPFICISLLIGVCDVTHSWVHMRDTCKTQLYVRHDLFTCVHMCGKTPSVYVTWLIHVHDITHSYVWHDSLLCVTWLIRICGMACLSVWHGACIPVTWPIHGCDMTHSCVRFDSSMCVTWLVILHINNSLLMHMPCHTSMCVDMYDNESCHTYGCRVPYTSMSHSSICAAGHVHPCDMTPSCVIKLIYMCTVTHSYVWYDSFICVIWLFHNVWRDSFICVTWLIHMCNVTHLH